MGEGLGCPWVSPSVNNEVGRLGWKKGYFHCSSDVTFSTGCSPQDSFSYFLFRFPAPHSSFGILDIVLFCFWHQKMDSWKFLHPLWQPAPAFTDIHSPRMSHDSPWADYLPPPNFCSSLRYGVEGEFSWLCGRLLFLVLFQQCGDHL